MSGVGSYIDHSVVINPEVQSSVLNVRFHSLESIENFDIPKQLKPTGHAGPCQVFITDNPRQVIMTCKCLNVSFSKSSIKAEIRADVDVLALAYQLRSGGAALAGKKLKNQQPSYRSLVRSRSKHGVKKW